jgi:hypothetical protein
MLNLIKQAALDAVSAASPLALLYGEVRNANPLEVTVDQRFTIDADFLVLTEATTERKVEIGGIEHTIRPGLRAGDKVVLLRMQGGQQYLVLDRVVKP